MRKLTPLFLLMAAFFLAAIAVGLGYERLQKNARPGGVIHVVSLLGDHAEPSLLTIKIGESVRFIAQDGIEHRITDGTVDSGIVKPGEDFQVQLKNPGNSTFKDSLHPKISVEVVVYDPNK
jgi:plastocyanin